MSKKAFAVLIKPLCDIYGEPKNWEAKIGIYFDALSDLPEYLLDAAVKHCIRASEFFPKPAELRAAIRDELTDLRRRQHAEKQRLLEPPPGESLDEIANRRRQLAPRFREAIRAIDRASAAIGRRSAFLKEPSDLGDIPPGEAERLSAQLARRRERETA